MIEEDKTHAISRRNKKKIYRVSQHITIKKCDKPVSEMRDCSTIIKELAWRTLFVELFEVCEMIR
jgi:hypothetical protein